MKNYNDHMIHSSDSRVQTEKSNMHTHTKRSIAHTYRARQAARRRHHHHRRRARILVTTLGETTALCAGNVADGHASDEGRVGIGGAG